MMGKAIDAGFVSGKTYPELFKNAYDFACQQHPEIRSLLAAKTAPVVANAAPTVKPVGQIKPSLSGGKQSTPPAKAMTLDEAVRAAATKHGV